MMTDVELSDGEVANVLDSIASDLRDGEENASNLRSDLVAILMLDSEVVVRDTSLESNGRLSFGRKHGGMEGVGLFLPEDATSEDF